MSVVCIIEGPYYRGYFYKECMDIFPEPSELSVLGRCPYYSEVSVRRGSTVTLFLVLYPVIVRDGR